MSSEDLSADYGSGLLRFMNTSCMEYGAGLVTFLSNNARAFYQDSLIDLMYLCTSFFLRGFVPFTHD